MTRTPGDAEPPAASYSVDHFTNLYLAKDDPWDNASKWSDQRKYAVTAASLPRARYRRCYEPGCAVGELTRILASRCDEVLAVDAVDAAVEQAREAVRDLPHVTVERAVLPAELPGGTFDLMVVGDLLYYLAEPDLALLVDGLVERLEAGGDLVSVHFRNRDTTGAYDGFNAHGAVGAHPGLEHVVHHDDEWFLLDVWRRG